VLRANEEDRVIGQEQIEMAINFGAEAIVRAEHVTVPYPYCVEYPSSAREKIDLSVTKAIA